LPPLAFPFPPQPQCSFCGADSAPPVVRPSRPRTSATTSFISASLSTLITSRLLLRVVNFFSHHIHCIDDADDYGIDGSFFEIGRQPRGTALAKENQFPDTCAHAVHSHNRVYAGAELCRVLVVH